MKFDFLSKIDLSGMDEVSVKSLQALQDAINATVGDFMNDTIDSFSCWDNSFIELWK